MKANNGILLQEEELHCTPGIEDYISGECLKHSSEGLGACFPTDLMKRIRGVAGFRETHANSRKARHR